MTRHHLRRSVSATAAALLVAAHCAPRGSQKEFESFNPTIQASHFKTIATIAGSSSRNDLAMSVQARLRLQKEGFNAVRAGGRWDNVGDMVGQICGRASEQPVDGVLLVGYNHIVLYDCQTTKAAYEIQSSPESGGLSFTQSLERFITYMKSGKTAAPTP